MYVSRYIKANEMKGKGHLFQWGRVDFDHNFEEAGTLPSISEILDW